MILCGKDRSQRRAVLVYRPNKSRMFGSCVSRQQTQNYYAETRDIYKKCLGKFDIKD